MKQRLLSTLLAAGMLFSFAVSALAAGTTLTLSVPNKLPGVGETFTVTVNISGNPGLCAAQYTLSFDKSVVSCERVTVGEVLKGTLSATNESASKGAIVACASVEAKTDDGILSTYQFRVLSSGEPGFALTDGIFSDASGESVATNVEIAEVTKPAEQTRDTNPTEQTPNTGPAEQVPDEEPAEQAGNGAEVLSTKTFPDVPESFWGYGYIEKAVALGLVSGNPDGTFAPQKPMTRAEFVTVLYRLSDETAGKTAQFADVPADSWYLDAVSWAAERGYATGNGVKFYPNGKITRQEVVTILYRYNGGTCGMESLLAAFGVDNLAGFADNGSVSSWAMDAMRWAIYSGLLTGRTTTTLAPLDSASRAEITAIFVRYAETTAS